MWDPKEWINSPVKTRVITEPLRLRQESHLSTAGGILPDSSGFHRPVVSAKKAGTPEPVPAEARNDDGD
jgi:hypothetical protein